MTEELWRILTMFLVLFKKNVEYDLTAALKHEIERNRTKIWFNLSTITCTA